MARSIRVFKNDYKFMENMYFSDKEIDYQLKSIQYRSYRPWGSGVTCPRSHTSRGAEVWLTHKTGDTLDYPFFTSSSWLSPTFALQILDHDWLIRIVVPNIVNSMSESVLKSEKKNAFHTIDNFLNLLSQFIHFMILSQAFKAWLNLKIMLTLCQAFELLPAYCSIILCPQTSLHYCLITCKFHKMNEF